MENLCLDTEGLDVGERIDKYLANELTDYSRSYIQKLITDGNVLVGGNIIKSNYKIHENDVITIHVPDCVALSIEPEDIPLEILYEDDDVILVNKPKGMVVHPAAGHYSKTLVNALLYHCKGNLSGINGVLRPGIVHRIDKDTTGVLIVCKNDFAHNSLAEQLRVHSITRKYEAICVGTLKDEDGTIDAPLGRSQTDRKKRAIDRVNGKEAITHYHLIENLKGYAHIQCQLETGRTHQIRVHMASIHHPLLGDDVYGSAKQPFSLEGQTLHAKVLGFTHPRTGEYMEFEAPLPAYFQELLRKLKQ